MGTKKLTVISISDSSLESIQNSAISVANQKRRQDRSNNYICDVFSVKHKTQFYAVDDDFVSIINSDGNVLKSDYITSTKLGEELAKISSSDTLTLDEDRVNELIDNKVTTLDLDNKFNSKANVDDVYTKSEVDEKVATISNNINLDEYVREEALTNLATKDEVNAKLDSSTYTTDKATFATKAQINGKANKDEVYSKTEIDAMVEAIPTTDIDLSEYATTEQLNLALLDKADRVMVDSLATKEEVNEEIAKLATKDEITPINEKIIVIEESIERLATKEDVTNSLATKVDSSVIPTLATKDEIARLANQDELTPINNKLAEIETLVPNFATKDEIAEFANMDTIRLELESKADVSVIDTLATKVELGSYALKSEVPTGVTVDDEQIARAVNENSKIQELSSTVANLSSNLQGATYPQLVATFNYLGYSLPTTLTLYDTYTLDTISGEDTTLTISVLEHTSGYSGLCNLAVYNDNDERLVIKSYIQNSEKVARIILAPTSSDINPTINEVVQTPQDYQLENKEVEVELNFSNAYSGTPSWYSTLSDAQYCSDGASLPVFNFTFKRFKPKRFEIKASYNDGRYAIVKANIAITHGALYNEPIAPYNKSSDNILVVDMVNLDMNVNIDDKYRELVTAWNVVPKPFTPPRLISFNEFTSSLNVSKDSPFVLTLKATKFHTNMYGVGISNVEFFINGNERLYPKYAQLMSGSNDMAEFILTKDESQKVNVMTPIPSEYDYKANNEYYVKAKRISAEYSSSYTFSEMLFYTAPGGYDNEYLTGSGLVEIEFYCDFIPSKLQFIQSPYGHGKAVSYETYHNGTKLTEVAYMGGTYDYEIHDFEGIKFKIYDNL
ncbi:hypothetical protein V2I21_08510 [Campylobacter sp. CLAX-22107-21]|uniref:hypothetical protein n=1 Tax=Campylobacter devanensis TaxID=3161138 RepID=UPI002EA9AB49|nr:hypothetical protein [Campylobacter sp. CLAX-22107-21]